MQKNLEVRSGPNYYECQKDVLSSLEEKLITLNYKKALWIHGRKSLEAAQPFLPQFHYIQSLFVPYEEKCSLKERDRLASKAEEFRADIIISLGGGNVLDLGKAVANVVDCEVILIPTLASTCSAWTPKSLMYKDGQFHSALSHPKQALMVLIEPRIILHSPVAYLRSGISNTLAKWYELDALMAKEENKTFAMELAHQIAHNSHTLLLAHGKQALIDLATVKLSASLLKTIEIIIMGGGIASSFNSQHETATLFQNSISLNSSSPLLLGEKAAYGIFIQLALEENWDEIDRILPFYRQIKLPYGENIETVEKLASFIAQDKRVHVLFPSLTQQEVADSIQALLHHIQQNERVPVL